MEDFGADVGSDVLAPGWELLDYLEELAVSLWRTGDVL